MKPYIFRNYTIESLFQNLHFEISGYGDVNIPVDEHEYFLLFYQTNPTFTPEKQIEEVGEIINRINFLIQQIPAHKQILILTLSENYIRDWELGGKILYNIVYDFNHDYLIKLEKQFPRIKIIDINSFKTSHSLTDWRFLFLSQMIINPKISKEFEHWYTMQVKCIKGSRKKCIILDCDNTLWGGIVGEDGTHGIKLGYGYPGECFKRFQELLVTATTKGVILAICSKNNQEDVEKVWEDNVENLLNSNHISAYRINWEDKVYNIKSIANQLNIGLDSCVFIDDSPNERELVKKYLPEVEVPDFPQDSYELITFFWDLYSKYFSIYKLSEEDNLKTKYYQDNLSRSKLLEGSTNIDEYLSSLDIQIDIYHNAEQNIMRIAQMMNKTNQFNLTTKRYSEDDIFRLHQTGYNIFSVKVKDKFGDNGITATCIIIIDNQHINIDSYLLSCRILGRKIENVVLLYILKLFCVNKNLPIKALYKPTLKNIICKTFFEDLGFQVLEELEDGTKTYLCMSEKLIEYENNYSINFYGKSN